MRSAMYALLVLVALVGVACSGDDAAPGEGPDEATPAPTATATIAAPSATATAPAPTPTASATSPVSVAVTRDALMAVGDQVFPFQPQASIYAVCGTGGDVSACPYTQRLKDRLEEAQATLCRCQNPSQTREMSAEVADFGGVLYVALYDGRQSYMITVVQEDGRLLVDDQTCMGAGPETSIYQSLAPCS